MVSPSTKNVNKARTTLRGPGSGREGTSRLWVARLPLALLFALLSLLPGPALAQQAVVYSSVSTIHQLRWAMANAQHIVVNAHLDLSWERIQPNSAWMFPLQGVRSIRVRQL